MSSEFVEDIHVRLREELEAHGYSLAEASRLMHEKSAQRLRDVVNGRQKMSAELLAKASLLSVDISYVLTGQRQEAEGELSPDESALLDNYRHLDKEQKAALNTVSNSMAVSAEAKKEAQG